MYAITNMNFRAIIQHLCDFAGVFIFWAIIHFAAANLYSTFCCETSIVGFIKSIFIIQTPHCAALRWIIYNGGSAINNMWTSIGLWIAAKILAVACL